MSSDAVNFAPVVDAEYIPAPPMGATAELSDHRSMTMRDLLAIAVGVGVMAAGGSIVRAGVVAVAVRGAMGALDWPTPDHTVAFLKADHVLKAGAIVRHLTQGQEV